MRAVSAFQAGIAERSAVFSCSIGVLSQHGVGMRSLERIWGLTYTIAPVESPFAIYIYIHTYLCVRV